MLHRYFGFCALLLLTLSLSAQDTKGVQPINQKPSNQKPGTQHSTRAVVVGISDYQSASVPDLKYANRDAEVFVTWLKSSAGGSVPPENVQLLTNEKATQAKLVAALDWLVQASKPGDEAIIYFSGHGDVETKSFSQMGFLLMWDCSGQNYMAGGAFPVFYLQDIVSGLSLGKNCRVVLVTDACHAGKLAGSDIGGGQLTGMNLQRQYANEVKIMSCQPNEFSLEGAQWDGGRGVFSYHLIDGLTGMADRDADLAVSLSEIDRYLEDKVSAETAPQVQTPFTVGDKQTILLRVDPASLATLRARREQQVASMAPTDSKGAADVLLDQSDSLTKTLYRQFEVALDKGDLLEPKGACANDLYLRLLQEESLHDLHDMMCRNLAAALQDEVQQALNALLQSDPYEVNNWLYDPAKYVRYPDYLQRSIELLGETHYMYKALMSKKLYFEAYNMTYNLGETNPDKTIRDSIKAVAKAKLLNAIDYESRAAYLYFGIGMLYQFQTPAMSDSLVKYCQMALDRSPKWLLPYLEIAYECRGSKAETWLKKALQLDTASYVILERLAWLYQWTNNTGESLRYCRKMIDTKPDLFNGYATMGVTWTGIREIGEAEKYFSKAIALNPQLENWAYHFMIPIYLWTGRTQLALNMVDQVLQTDSLSVGIKGAFLGHLSYHLVETRHFEMARKYLDAWQSLSIYEPGNCLHLKGIVAFEQGNMAESRAWFSKAIAQFNIEPVWLHLRSQIYFARIEAHLGQASLADSIFRACIAYLHTPGLDLRTEIPGIEELYYSYGQFLLHQGRRDAAAQQFQKVIDITVGYRAFLGYYGMAMVHAAQNENKTALDYLEKALDNYFYPTPEVLDREPLFQKLRKTKRFRALLAKHFPETASNKN